MLPPLNRPPYGTTADDERPTVGELRVGCAMWAHRAWIGRHLPADTPPGGELAAYGTWVRTVEGNTTFYATPTSTTIERWRADSPDGFQFCFKLPRAITHERRLRNSTDLLHGFHRRVAPMGERLGPIQIQLPPSFSGPDLPVLAEFLGQLPPAETGWAVELRHPDFFVGGSFERAVDDLLIERGVNRVILDSRALFDRPPVTEAEHDAWAKKPRLPVRPMATADRPLVRLIGNSDPDANLERWDRWTEAIARWLTEGRSPSVFTHTPDNVDALPLARRMHEAIADACERMGRPRPLLPRAVVATEQLGLLDAERGRSG